MLLPPFGGKLKKEFICRSLSITEWLLWTLQGCNWFSLCRINKRYLWFVICTRGSICFFFIFWHNVIALLTEVAPGKEKKRVKLNRLALHSLLGLRLFLKCTFQVFISITRETWFSKPSIVRYKCFFFYFSLHHFIFITFFLD